MRKHTIFLVGFTTLIDHKVLAKNLTKALKTINSAEDTYIVHTLLCAESDDAVRSTLIKEQLDTPCDLVISIGFTITETLMRVYQTITPIPTIFFGIPEPLSAGIVSSLEQPGGFFSGVAMESASPQRLIKLLCCLRPHVKKIFIPYEAQGFNGIVNERAEAIINALTQKKFEAIPHIISEPQEAIDALEKNIENIDAVMLIEGCVSSYFATSYISYICALTERIFINGDSGLYSITAQGATFGYGTDGESPFTQEILNMVQRVLKDKQPIGTQAVITLPDTRKLFANSFHLSILPRSIVKNIESNPEIITEFYWSNSPIIFLNEDGTPLPNEASSVSIQ